MEKLSPYHSTETVEQFETLKIPKEYTLHPLINIEHLKALDEMLVCRTGWILIIEAPTGRLALGSHALQARGSATTHPRIHFL